MLEALQRPDKVELVGILLAEPGQDRYLDLALPRVRRVVFEDFDGDDVACALFPAFYHLPERAPAEELQHLEEEEEEERKKGVSWLFICTQRDRAEVFARDTNLENVYKD